MLLGHYGDVAVVDACLGEMNAKEVKVVIGSLERGDKNDYYWRRDAENQGVNEGLSD